MTKLVELVYFTVNIMNKHLTFQRLQSMAKLQSVCSQILSLVLWLPGPQAQFCVILSVLSGYYMDILYTETTHRSNRAQC